MKLRPVLTPALLLLTLFLVGCETSQFPISEPGDAPINQEYLGSWTSSSDGDTYQLELMAFNRHEYFGYLVSSDGDEEDVVLRLFESEVGGGLLTNVQCFACEEAEERGFLFVRLAVTDGRLVVSFVDDDIFDEIKEATGPAQVQAYVAEHLEEAGFFDDENWEWDRVK